MKIIYCKYCGKPFETDGSFRMAGIATAHMRTCEHNPNRLKNIDSLKRGSMTMNRKVILKLLQLRFQLEQTRAPRTFICENPTCKREFLLNLTDDEYQKALAGKKYIRRFCSRSCANGRGCTHQFRSQHANEKLIELNRKIRISGRSYIKTYSFKLCLICNKWFLNVSSKQKCCSILCNNQLKKQPKTISDSTRLKLSLAGRKSATKQFALKRSKCEIEFYEYCKQRFDNVEHNKPIFNGWDADILLLDLNVAILWNGPWHYKLISKKKTASLASILNRDRIKRHEIKNAGWSLYVIKDLDSHKNAQKRAIFIERHFLRFIEFLNLHLNIQFYEEFEMI